MTEGTSLGDFVRKERERRGMTLTALAASAELSKSELSALERGKIALPGADKRRRLAKALGVSHLDVLVEAGEITKEEIGAAGAVGIVEKDPVLAELIADLRRLPLTGERPTTFRRLIDVFRENDRRTLEVAQARQEQKDAGGNTRVG